MTIAITNEPASLLAESARHVIELRTGPERSVAATKTYTASLGAVAALVGVDPRDLAAMPAAMERQLDCATAGRDRRRLGAAGRRSAAASPTGPRSRRR